MKFCTYVSCTDDILACKRAEIVSEVLIEPAALAMQGSLSKEEATSLARQATNEGLSPVLVWDIEMPQRLLDSCFEEISGYELAAFSSVRVRDLGAAQWLRENASQVKIQLQLEYSNHNLEALLGWSEYFSTQLERIVLSIELPAARIAEYCSKLPVQCEVLGAGPVMLFRTPRPLLSSVYQEFGVAAEDLPEQIEVCSSSEESSHRGFPTMENRHGTTMFLDKDYFLLDKLDALREGGLDIVRIDIRHLSTAARAAEDIERICHEANSDGVALKKSWPRKTTAAFFRTNKTTAQFHRLKSHLCRLRDDNCVAKVISSKRGSSVLYTQHNFSAAQEFTLCLPDGAEIRCEELEFRDLSGRKQAEFQAGSVILATPLYKATPGALLRKTE